jgi:hypothetical protein
MLSPSIPISTLGIEPEGVRDIDMIVAVHPVDTPSQA